ncbi:MAG: hypothetical protein K1060chlam4_00448 [Candidatus Anoxychlamydiales bacterium]|nr:hypothetical protein [Candidatus Anoxychlamydiales bacterium]
MPNYNFDIFETRYDLELDIYVSSKGDYFYTSTGPNAEVLLDDLVDQTSSARASYSAEI